MIDDVSNRVNQMGKEEGKKERIVCTDMFGKVTLDNLDYRNYDVNDDNSNVLDNSYKFNDKEFHDELDNENKLDNKHGIGNDKIQADYFINDSDDSKSDEDNNVN